MNVPQVRGRDIIIIRFDENGVVQNVQHLDLSNQILALTQEVRNMATALRDREAR